MNELITFQINDTTPFHSPSDTAFTALAEAHALLALLAAAEQVCENATEEAADPYENLRNGIMGRGLDGISTLVSFAQFNLDLAYQQRHLERRIGAWGQRLSAYQTAKARMEEHAATDDKSECGSPENVAYEAKTATLANAQADAFNALMLTPAPDRKALSFKCSEYSEFTQGDSWLEGAKILTQIAADAKRLEV